MLWHPNDGYNVFLILYAANSLPILTLQLDAMSRVLTFSRIVGESVGKIGKFPKFILSDWPYSVTIYSLTIWERGPVSVSQPFLSMP